MAKYKTLIVMLLLLSLFGQAAASVNNSCLGFSYANAGQDQMATAMVDHSQHAAMMALITDEQNNTDNCCGCDCRFDGCGTMAVIDAAAQTLASTWPAAKPCYNNNKLSHSLVASLFRPPITS
ncbi:hypothetical protein NO559_12310 [Dasania sp. GY-MA-18]|nr:MULTISPECIES: hypothetical protein [Dasania]MCR8923559.1 hypothetical protein [Dasania sp. GY-MA-18]